MGRGVTARKRKQHATGGSVRSPASLANLKNAPAAQQGNLRAMQHGAASEALIRPLAETYLAELQREFPAASERVLKLQARRLAKLDRLGSYLEAHGEIRHQRRGEVFPASQLEESITAAFLATQARLEAQQREAAGDPATVLARIVEDGS
jgi:hypothetical protein